MIKPKFCVNCAAWAWLSRPHGLGACMKRRIFVTQGETCGNWSAPEIRRFIKKARHL